MPLTLKRYVLPWLFLREMVEPFLAFKILANFSEIITPLLVNCSFFFDWRSLKLIDFLKFLFDLGTINITFSVEPLPEMCLVNCWYWIALDCLISFSFSRLSNLFCSFSVTLLLLNAITSFFEYQNTECRQCIAANRGYRSPLLKVRYNRQHQWWS